MKVFREVFSIGSLEIVSIVSIILFNFAENFPSQTETFKLPLHVYFYRIHSNPD